MPRPEFQSSALNSDGLKKKNDLAEIFTEALNKIEALIPAGRERAIVVTKLQEAAFFAKRAIALDPTNQHPVSALTGSSLSALGH